MLTMICMQEFFYRGTVMALVIDREAVDWDMDSFRRIWFRRSIPVLRLCYTAVCRACVGVFHLHISTIKTTRLF
jgi:hypothetical protein